MCCRNEEKAKAARQDIVKHAGADESKVHIVLLDLADLESVATFRSRYNAVPGLDTKPIDMLILNAGAQSHTYQLSKQGIELTMAGNLVGHFQFAACMFDLCKAAPSSRIVYLTSPMHKMTKTIDIEDFNHEKHFASMTVYSQSKLGVMLVMFKLNRLLEENGVSNVIAVASHP